MPVLCIDFDLTLTSMHVHNFFSALLADEVYTNLMLYQHMQKNPDEKARLATGELARLQNTYDSCQKLAHDLVRLRLTKHAKREVVSEAEFYALLSQCGLPLRTVDKDQLNEFCRQLNTLYINAEKEYTDLISDTHYNLHIPVAIVSFSLFPGAIQAVLKHLGGSLDRLIHIQAFLPSTRIQQQTAGKSKHIRNILQRLRIPTEKFVVLIDDDAANVAKHQAEYANAALGICVPRPGSAAPAAIQEAIWGALVAASRLFAPTTRPVAMIIAKRPSI